MKHCTCTPAEAAGFTEDPWHTQPHPQPAQIDDQGCIVVEAFEIV